jgi:hypothetical protein
MQKIMEVFAVLENAPGRFAQLLRLLRKKHIQVHAAGLFGETARLHLSHPEKAIAVFAEVGIEAELHEVLLAAIPNKEGALLELTQKLGNAGINILYLYGASESKSKRALLVLEVDKPDLAVDIFRHHQFVFTGNGK